MRAAQQPLPVAAVERGARRGGAATRPWRRRSAGAAPDAPAGRSADAGGGSLGGRALGRSRRPRSGLAAGPRRLARRARPPVRRRGGRGRWPVRGALGLADGWLGRLRRAVTGGCLLGGAGDGGWLGDGERYSGATGAAAVGRTAALGRDGGGWARHGRRVRSGRRRGQPGDRRHRDGQPVGAVPGLVHGPRTPPCPSRTRAAARARRAGRCPRPAA